MVIADILFPFAAVLLMEVGDKTQIAIFSLSAKYKSSIAILLGALLAFILIDGAAILLGNILSDMVPILYLSLFSAFFFIFSGIVLLIQKEEKNEEINTKAKNLFFLSFISIVLLEMGDKSQLSAMVFAGIYHPMLVFIGVITALLILSLAAVYLGRKVQNKLKDKYVKVVTSFFFFVMGISIIIKVFLEYFPLS